ncbi:LamB/YcsF family protein, partial [Acinetobacter baumannii]
DSAFVASRVVSMLKNGGVESIDGVFTPIQADTICLHGDTDGALEMSAAIKAELVKNNIEIRPFVNKA